MTEELLPSGAPFNFALDTLMRIAAILEEITKISINERSYPDITIAQYQKWKAVKQLYRMSVPLINKEEDRTKLKAQLNQIKLTTVYDARLKEQRALIYSQEVDEELDEMVESTQLTLQKDKYFMPPRTDLRYGWKQR